MDSFITSLILIVVAAIIAWFRKLGQDQTGRDRSSGRPDSMPQRPGTPPRTSPGPSSWEEELRRLLEGESPTAPRPTRPPVVISQPPRTAPPVAPPIVRPVLISSSRPVPAAAAPPPMPAKIETSAGQLASLRESRQAYERASTLDVSVAQHIQGVPGQAVQATSVIRRPVSAEITQAVSLFKNAQTSRQAVLASIILGPPRSLEEFAG